MRIAISLDGQTLSPHFGHCARFAFVDADAESKSIRAVVFVPAPEHQPGLLPVWLKERGADVVIAARMGSRAKALLEESGVEVVAGAPALDAETLAGQYLQGTLVTTEQPCGH